MLILRIKVWLKTIFKRAKTWLAGIFERETKDEFSETVVEIKNLFQQIFERHIETAERNGLFAKLIEDSFVYITDIDTYEVLWMNDNLKQLVGKNEDNKPCYKLFQNHDEPCSFCNNDVLLKNPDKVLHWTHYNKKTGRIYFITDYYIKRINGQERNLRIEEAKDITYEINNICNLKKELRNDRERTS